MIGQTMIWNYWLIGQYDLVGQWRRCSRILENLIMLTSENLRGQEWKRSGREARKGTSSLNNEYICRIRWSEKPDSTVQLPMGCCQQKQRLFGVSEGEEKELSQMSHVVGVIESFSRKKFHSEDWSKSRTSCQEEQLRVPEARTDQEGFFWDSESQLGLWFIFYKQTHTGPPLIIFPSWCLGWGKIQQLRMYFCLFMRGWTVFKK